MEAVLTPIQPPAPREKALAATYLEGSVAGLEKYLQLRTVQFHDLPLWAQNAGFAAARDEFRSYGKTSQSEVYTLIDSMIEKRYVQNLLIRPVIRGLIKTEPEDFAREIKRVFHKHMDKASFSFSQKHLRDLGVCQEQTLAAMLLVPSAIERSKEILSASAITELVNKSKSISIGSLIDFDPSSGKKVGEPARRARAAIADIAVRCCIVEDVLKRDGVTLDQSRQRELIQKTWSIPYAQISTQPIFSSLAQLAQQAAKLPQPLEYVSALELFGVFGMSGVGLDGIIRIDQQRRASKIEAERAETITPAPIVVNSTSQTAAQRRVEIERVISEVFIEAAPQLIRSLTNVAIKKKMSLEELRSHIETCESNPQRLLDDLRNIGRVEKRTSASAQLPRVFRAVPTIELEPRQIFYHAENGRSPTEEWLDSLDKTVRKEVDKQIDALAHRRISERHYRKLVQRAFTTGESNASELKCGNLRIYFRFLPGDRVVFLHHGHKDAQERDAVIAFKRAAEYNGFKADTPLGLKLHELKNSRPR